MKLIATALATVAMANPAKIQLQGRNQQGGSWSAEKSSKGVFYQEGGESFVAFPSDFTQKGKGVYTSCVTNGPCQTAQIQYETYSLDMNTGILSASGTYASGLVIDMVVDELPDGTNMFFGEFTFSSNKPGLEGTGRFANAFVEDAQTSFDSRNEQPQ